jgi:hypothetical protein
MSGGEGEGGKSMRQWNVTGWVCDMETYTHGTRTARWERERGTGEGGRRARSTEEVVGVGLSVLLLCRGSLHREWKGAMA